MDKQRICNTCKDKFPLTKEYFDRFPKGFTYACRWCRGTATDPKPGIEQKPKTIKCVICKKEYPLDDKYLVENSDFEHGFESVCRKCQEKQIETRTCSKCKEEFELTPDNFHRDKTAKAGLDYMCKDCRNEVKRVQWKKRRGGAVIPEGCILLDLREDDALKSKIEEWAKNERRAPDQQILWNLEQEVLKAG